MQKGQSWKCFILTLQVGPLCEYSSESLPDCPPLRLPEPKIAVLYQTSPSIGMPPRLNCCEHNIPFYPYRTCPRWPHRHTLRWIFLNFINVFMITSLELSIVCNRHLGKDNQACCFPASDMLASKHRLTKTKPQEILAAPSLRENEEEKNLSFWKPRMLPPLFQQRMSAQQSSLLDWKRNRDELWKTYFSHRMRVCLENQFTMSVPSD